MSVKQVSKFSLYLIGLVSIMSLALPGMAEETEEVPADDPWFTFCLIHSEPGEDFGNCINGLPSVQPEGEGSLVEIRRREEPTPKPILQRTNRINRVSN